MSSAIEMVSRERGRGRHEKIRAFMTAVRLGLTTGADIPRVVIQAAVAAEIQTGNVCLGTGRGSKRDAADLVDRVKKRLNIDRILSSDRAFIVEFAMEIGEKIKLRKRRKMEDDASANRTFHGMRRDTYLALRERVLRSLRDTTYAAKLVRSTGGTSYEVSIVSDYRSPENASGVRCYTASRTNTFDPSIGQIKVDVIVYAEVRKDWYSYVYKRGIAVVEGQFVCDCLSYSLAPDGSYVAKVKYGRSGPGFMCVNAEGVVVGAPRVPPRFVGSGEIL